MIMIAGLRCGFERLQAPSLTIVMIIRWITAKAKDKLTTECPHSGAVGTLAVFAEESLADRRSPSSRALLLSFFFETSAEAIHSQEANSSHRGPARTTPIATRATLLFIGVNDRTIQTKQSQNNGNDATVPSSAMEQSY
jgi:hypothetical protein